MELFVNPSEYERLDIKAFSKALDNTTQSYKYFWLEAVLQCVEKGEKTALFEDLVDQMIINAWPLVSKYHLKMGISFTGEPTDHLEMIINAICRNHVIIDKPTDSELKRLIHEDDSVIKKWKLGLLNYVPYKLLSGFREYTGLTKKEWNDASARKMHEALTGVQVRIPYHVHLGDSLLQNYILVDDVWFEFFKREMSILRQWNQYNKVLYLERRNPNVPGILQKADRDLAKVRYMNHVINLWNAVLDTVDWKFIDIYDHSKILKAHHYDMDHFIPWSFVACDELWNLLPADPHMNRKKSDWLPNVAYYADYADRQYKLYKEIHKCDGIRELYEKCKGQNMNENWAYALYEGQHNKDEFEKVLIDNIDGLSVRAVHADFVFYPQLF